MRHSKIVILLVCSMGLVLAGITPSEEALAAMEGATSLRQSPSNRAFVPAGEIDEGWELDSGINTKAIPTEDDSPFSEEELAEASRVYSQYLAEDSEHEKDIVFRGVISKIACAACSAAYRTFRYMEKFRPVRWSTVKFAQIYCRVARIMDKNVCNAVIEEFQGLFMFVIRNKNVDPEDACGIMSKYTGCPAPKYPTWDVTFDKPKPPINPYPEVKEGDETFLMLHLTDLHVDYDYTVGYEADCGEPICCRPPFNKPNPKRPAGQWGDYGCDAPKTLYLNMLDFLKEKFGDKLSFGILTGDLPPHDVWQETRNHTVAIEEWLADEFHRSMPNLKLYPAVGNHESVPVNEFAPRSIKDAEFEMSWLYETLADKWAYWIPEDAVQMARHAGYYTALSPEGVRIISLNTNIGCNHQNWYLMFPSEDNKDPDNMLHWFADAMKAAEEAGEMVYLIYHISPNNKCTGSWFENFFKIVYRYENTILAHFSGHTHMDKFSVTYALDGADGKPRPLYTTNFAGSMSPGGKRNPTFRVYEVDRRTKAIIDYTQYRANLTLANIEGKVTWEELYKAKSAYRMKDYSPESWHQASALMLADPDMNMFYYNMTSREADPVVNKCKQKCLDKVRHDTYKPPPGYSAREIYGAMDES